MKLPTWIAVCLLALSACSTAPQVPPAKIDPPPVALVTPCGQPRPLPAESTVNDLASWAIDWIGYGGCEASKRKALIESWPK